MIIKIEMKTDNSDDKYAEKVSNKLSEYNIHALPIEQNPATDIINFYLKSEEDDVIGGINIGGSWYVKHRVQQ